MKEELLELYKDFLEAFQQREKEIYDRGGSWGRKPDLEMFMEYLKYGYII